MSQITRANVNNYQYFDAINRRYWDRKYIFENFRQNPTSSAIGGGASTGTAGDENVLVLPTTAFEYHILGTQTITAPSLTTSGNGGLNIGMDQTDNDGVELGTGITARNPNAFVIGTDDPFFFRVRFSIADVSGTDDCAIGFRLAEAYQANIDDYADMAVLNVISGNITIETIKSSAATVVTDTTDDWADTETHELKVLVDENGVVTYAIDNAAPTVTAAYTFTVGLTVVPFLYFLHATDLAGPVVISDWECGFQE